MIALKLYIHGVDIDEHMETEQQDWWFCSKLVFQIQGNLYQYISWLLPQQKSMIVGF